MNRLTTFLIALAALQVSLTTIQAQPIQNELNANGSELNAAAVNADGAPEVAEAPASAPANTPASEPTAVEYLAVSPQWFGGYSPAETEQQTHDRSARHIGFGGLGGGFVGGGIVGGAVATPIYTVPVVQTVPVITTVPVVSTISTYPTYAGGYGYGGYGGVGGFAPIGGFGGFGFGKVRSSFTAKGFGVGGGFIG